MPDSFPDGSPASPGGVVAETAALVSAKLAYLRARIELAGIEGKEAALHYAVILGLAIGALIVIVFGYLFLVIALVFLIAWACGGGNAWIWVTMGAGLTHILGAGVLLVIAKRRLGRRMFGATMGEFRKDQECLTTIANRN